MLTEMGTGNQTNKIHCKHCNERLALRNGEYEKYAKVEYLDTRVCSSSAEGHEPR